MFSLSKISKFLTTSRVVPFCSHRHSSLFSNKNFTSACPLAFSVNSYTSQQQQRSLSTSNQLLAAKNFYKVLGVNENATQKEIKQAYYKLAKKHHPDANPDNKAAADKFAAAAEAYEVLGDEGRRKEYDTLGASGYEFKQSGGTSGSPGAGNPFGGQHQNIDPQDLFESIFSEFAGQGGRRARRQSMGDFFDGFGHRGNQEYRTYESDYVGGWGKVGFLNVLSQRNSKILPPTLFPRWI